MRPALAAGGLATLGSLPIFLLSAQAVSVGQDLGLDAAGLGWAASCFFGVAAVVSLACGGLVDRLPTRVAILAATSLSAAACLGIAFGARTVSGLLALLALGGAGNALLQVTANVILARLVPPGRRGLAYAIKQSAIPLAVIVGGLAVPTIGAFVDWRSMFTITAGAFLLVAATRLRQGSAPVPHAVPTRARDLPPRGALLVTAVATMLGSAAAVSLGAFLPAWAHDTGLTTDQAALLLSFGGACSLLARLGSGLAADRRSGWHLPVVSLHLGVGALGVVLISLEAPTPLVLGTVIAFGVGWSWPGVLLFALVRVGRDSPGSASSAVQGGNFAGAALGPALFGYVVATAGFVPAWRLAAVAMVAGALLLVLARGMFVSDRRRRPPARAFD